MAGIVLSSWIEIFRAGLNSLSSLWYRVGLDAGLSLYRGTFAMAELKSYCWGEQQRK
jgi:hypothetical protein